MKWSHVAVVAALLALPAVAILTLAGNQTAIEFAEGSIHVNRGAAIILS
jgi:hypothetical protein